MSKTPVHAAERPAAMHSPDAGRQKVATVSRKGRMSRRAIEENFAAYLLLAPALILLTIWFVFPIVSSLILSFQKINIFHFDEREFVGLDNYAALFRDPVFINTIRITLSFVLLVVPAQTILALLAAVAVHSMGAAKVFFRTAFFAPYVTSTVAVTTIFMNLFTRNGGGATLLSHFGLPNTTWYTDVNLALVFLAIIYVWMNIGLYMIIFLSGLQTVPAALNEAAMVDGANVWQRFRHITVPTLRPFTFFVAVSGLIAAFQVFDPAYVISNGTTIGGPAGATSTLVVFIFAQAFRYNKLGYASAAAVVLLLIVLLTTLVLRRLFREEATDAN